ncbi:MAG: DUF4214 domain-containing protein [Acidimicrobiales bacterium]
MSPETPHTSRHNRTNRFRRLVVMAAAAAGLAATSLTVAPPEPAAAASPPVTSVLCGQPGADLVRLYRAFFGRVPDQSGLQYWSDQYLMSDMANVAYWMSQSTEYQQTWVGTSDRDYVSRLLYQNLLQREPDAGGFEFWLNDLAKAGRVDQVRFWVQQPELVANHPVVEPEVCRQNGVTLRDIPGGRAADVNYLVADLKTSASRCSVASINANWLTLSNNQPIGLGVIDGKQVPGGVDRQDRGVIGERYRPNGPIAELTHDWDNAYLTHNLAQKGNFMLEVERDWQRDGMTDPNGYRWAASGIVMAIKGQISVTDAVINASAYTMLTTRHSFVAFKAPSTVTFGSTTSMTAPQMRDWLLDQGYTDIVKMDGGASVEFNEGGRVTVAGTSRAIPVWLGVGC